MLLGIRQRVFGVLKILPCLLKGRVGVLDECVHFLVHHPSKRGQVDVRVEVERKPGGGSPGGLQGGIGIERSKLGDKPQVEVIIRDLAVNLSYEIALVEVAVSLQLNVDDISRAVFS